MIEHRELISICRQIGSMMEAGVDILRITRVLRAQTENPRLLDAYNKLDHDLRMGQSLADAMEQSPEVFSPFAVSLVRQGEARNDIAGAFHKIADFLQKEDEVAVTHQAITHQTGQKDATVGGESTLRAPSVVTPSAILPVWVVEDLISRAQVAALRIFTVASGLLLTLAAVWASVEAGFVERRWQNVVVCSVTALFIGGAGIWLRRRIDEDSSRAQERRRILEEQAQSTLREDSATASMPTDEVFPRGSREGTTAWAAENVNSTSAPFSDSANVGMKTAGSRPENEATFE